jgi:hypothetical protein
MLGYTCVAHGVELRCKKNGVYLVHFIDGDPEKGIDAVRSGDLYECPVCGHQVVLGLSKEELLSYALTPEFTKHIMDNYYKANQQEIIVVNRQ